MRKQNAEKTDDLGQMTDLVPEVKSSTLQSSAPLVFIIALIYKYTKRNLKSLKCEVANWKL
jgi:hypothetical protein